MNHHQMTMLLWLLGCAGSAFVIGLIMAVVSTIFWGWPEWKSTMAHDAVGVAAFAVMLISGILQRDLDRVSAGGSAMVLYAWHLWDTWRKHRKKRSPGRLLGWLVVDLGHRLGTERA